MKNATDNKAAPPDDVSVSQLSNNVCQGVAFLAQAPDSGNQHFYPGGAWIICEADYNPSAS